MAETIEDLKAEDLRVLVAELRSEIQRLKDRPPMACFSCEQFNHNLADELDSIKRFEIQTERESLAQNSYLSGWAYAKGVDLLDDFLNKKDRPEVIAAFKEWWKTYRNIS